MERSREALIDTTALARARVLLTGLRPRSPRGEALWIGLLVAVGYLLLRMSDRIAIGAFRDDGIYISLGKALASGQGYHSIYAVGAPVHLKYPPGLPALFAILWAGGRSLAGVTDLALALSLGVSASAAALLWWIARTELELPLGIAILATAAPFFLEGAIQYFNLAISEPYFVLAWAGGLVLYRRARDARTETQRARRAVLLGLAIAGAVLLRTQGVALWGAFLLAAILDRFGWRASLSYALTAAAPLAAWFWLHRELALAGPPSSQPDEVSYLSWIPFESPIRLWAFVRSAAVANWTTYWHYFPWHLSRRWEVGFVLCALLALTALVGAAVAWRRHAAVTWTVLAVTTTVILWPYSQDRFVIAVLPFAGLLIGGGLARVLRARRREVRILFHILLALAFVPIAARQIQLREYRLEAPVAKKRGEPTYPAEFLTFNTGLILTASRWVRQNTSSDDRILVDNAAGLYLYTGRRTVSSAPPESHAGPSPFDPPGAFLARRILEDDVTLVILGDLAMPLAREVAVVQQRCPDVLRFQDVAQSWVTVAFYRVARNDECLRKEVLQRLLGVGEAGDGTAGSSLRGPL